MRKQTKLAVVLAAAALLVIGASMTSFAAKGWTADGDDWYFVDNNGDAVIDTWKSYNGNYYYLGEDGVMVKDDLVDDGDYTYYVDANGAMVKNKWVAIPADEDEEQDVEYRWMYFGSTGKAYKSEKFAKKTIDGKKYAFDADGKMLFGFVDVEGDDFEIVNGNDNPILDAEYYFGSNDNGSMQTGWVNYVDGLENEAYDGDSYWFYFNTSTGKKIAATDDDTPNGDYDSESGKLDEYLVSKTIDGRKYYFDEAGVMQAGWSAVQVAADATYSYLSLDNEGWMQKNTWVWAVPTAEMGDGSDNEEDTCRWFRVNASGKLEVNKTKKIDGKWYVFDKDGIMKTGLVRLVNTSEATEQRVNGAQLATASVGDESWDADSYTGQEILDLANGDANFYFFSTEEETDGSMKTGTIQVDLEDDTYTMGFDGTTGRAFNGVEGNKLYRNGILRSAGDDRYCIDHAAAVDGSEGKYYLVGSTGNVIKAGKYYKDADDNYYATFNKGYYTDSACTKKASSTQYDILKVDGAYEDAQKIAKEFASYGPDGKEGSTLVRDYLEDTEGEYLVQSWNFHTEGE